MRKWYDPKWRVQCYYTWEPVSRVIPEGWTFGHYFTRRGAEKDKKWLERRLGTSVPHVERIED